MDLEMQKKQINELWSLLISKDQAVNKRRELMYNYENRLEDAAQMGLPVAPAKPREPKMPSRPKHVEADTKIKAKDFALGYISLIAKAASKKKLIKEAQEANERLEKEYFEKVEKYKKDHAKWEKDMAVYTDAYGKWQVAVKKKTAENIEKYKKDNAGTLVQVKKLEEEIANLEKAIAATTILSAVDRNDLNLVNYISLKLGTGRADSVMMALNMYDMERRQEAQHQARMQAEAFDRRMEADRRKQWEAEQSMKQWSHNRQMEEYARETRDYERQQAKDLEEIRKAADKLGR